MSNFIFENDGYEVDFAVNVDPTKWLIIADEQYRPDRGAFVMSRFKEDYPNINIGDNISKVYALCSRSAALNEWLAIQNLDYALIQNEPTFYRDTIDPDRFKLVSEELQDSSSRSRNRSSEELAAAVKYKAEMDKIEKKYSSFKFKIKEARVISMNTTELPLTLQLAIENYTPASDDSPNRRSFAREILINYKLGLLKIIKEEPGIDIEKFIKDTYTK